MRTSTTNQSYSLRKRMLARTALLLFVIFVLLNIGAWHYAKQAANYSYDRLLKSASLSMLEGVHVTGSRVDIDIPYAAFEMMQLAPDDKVFYRIQGPNGEFITGYQDLPLPKKIEPKSTTDFYNTTYLSEKVRVVVQRKWLSESGVSGWVSVALAQTLKARNEMRNDILYRSFLTLLGLLLLVLLVLWWAINRALEPLNAISQTLLAQPSLSATPLNATKIEEVAPLVNGINEYQARLSANLNTMKVFIADASHQIRTVQSATQAQLDIASQSQNIYELPDHLNKIREEHLRLTRLTNQLLSHAMVVHRGDTKSIGKVDLESLVKHLLTESVRDHAHRQIEFSYDCQSDIPPIVGDGISLKEALRNLLENAIHYGPENNQIDVSLQRQGACIDIVIDDSGPGIPKALRDQAKQRFQRLTKEKSGSGLGLAIVNSVVSAHGGHFLLEESPAGGLRVRIRLSLGDSL